MTLTPFDTLKTLHDAGAVKSYRIVGTAQGFTLDAHLPTDVMRLCTARGPERYFKTLNTAAETLRELGAVEATLDLRQWNPKQKGL